MTGTAIRQSDADGDAESRRRLYLLRHGEVRYFRPGGSRAGTEEVGLTERGRSQAVAVGQLLRQVRLDMVVTSGLPRTDETARLVLAQHDDLHGLPEPEAWPDLQELRPGDIDGIPDDGIEEAYLGLFKPAASREGRFLGGETLGSMLDRVNGALDRFMADQAWHTALLVLHGGVNRAILSRALTGGHEFFGHIEQSAACLNIIDHGPTWWVRTMNVTSYDLVQDGSRSTTVEQLLQQCLGARHGIAQTR